MSLNVDNELANALVLSLTADDIVVVRVTDKTKQEAEEIGLAVRQLIRGNKVLVIPENVRIEVIPSTAEVIVVGVK